MSYLLMRFKINYSFAPRVDPPHLLDLAVPLFDISLINAQGIDPVQIRQTMHLENAEAVPEIDCKPGRPARSA